MLQPNTKQINTTNNNNMIADRKLVQDEIDDLLNFFSGPHS